MYINVFLTSLKVNYCTKTNKVGYTNDRSLSFICHYSIMFIFLNAVPGVKIGYLHMIIKA